MRNTSRALLAVVTMLVALACGGGPSTTSNGGSAPIKIGILTASTGSFGSLGVGEIAAAKVALSEMNSVAGGPRFELVTKDDAGTPDQAISLTRQLVESDQVDVILGPGLTTTANAGFPLSNQLGVPTMSPTIVSPTAAPSNRPWTFSIGGPADILFPANFPAIKKTIPSVKKFAMAVSPECAGCVSESNFIADFLIQNGYEVVNRNSPVSIPATAADLSAQATTIAGLKPDALVGSASAGQWARLAKELQRRNLNIPAISGTGPGADEFLTTAGSAGENWMVLSAYWADNPDTAKEAAKLTNAIQAAKNDPKVGVASVDALYYDSMKIVAKVVADNKIIGGDHKKTRAAIRDGLQKMTGYSGLCGKMSMRNDGRMTIGGYVLADKAGKWSKLS